MEDIDIQSPTDIIDKNTKKCTKCGIVKNVLDFSFANKYKDYRSTHCKECRHKEYLIRKQIDVETFLHKSRIATNKWKDKNPCYRRESYTKKYYGKSADYITDYVNKINKVQKNKCAICGDVCDVVGLVKQESKKRLVLDHDHATGKLRGLLCDLCNTALGKFGDNIETLNKAILYLENWK